MNCLYCAEDIPPDEQGPNHQPVHWYCMLRMVVGSVAHQEGRCSCHVCGSDATDEPGLTPREAARAAAEYYHAASNR